VVSSAIDATGAEVAMLATVSGDSLRIVAAAGPGAEGSGPGAFVGQELGRSGTAAWVIGSGQPVAAQLVPGDERAVEEATLLGGRTPANILCVPCVWDDEPVGALELLNKAGAGRFTFDDVEVVTLLGAVAGAALVEGSDDLGHRSAAELGAALRRLEASDPAGFRVIATTLEAFLGRT
jgi:GAF domain-containing protein